MLCFAEHVSLFDVFSFKRKNASRPLFGAGYPFLGWGLGSGSFPQKTPKKGLGFLKTIHDHLMTTGSFPK